MKAADFGYRYGNLQKVELSDMGEWEFVPVGTPVLSTDQRLGLYAKENALDQSSIGDYHWGPTTTTRYANGLVDELNNPLRRRRMHPTLPFTAPMAKTT